MGCAASTDNAAVTKEAGDPALNNGNPAKHHTNGSRSNHTSETTTTSSRRSTNSINNNCGNNDNNNNDCNDNNNTKEEETKIDSSPTEDLNIPTTKAVFGNFADVRYACATKQGFNPDEEGISNKKPNQDSYCVRYGNFAGVAGDAFLGVYDGHGPYGHFSSRMAAKRLPELIQEQIQQVKEEVGLSPGEDLTTEGHIHFACCEAHLECDKEMHDQTTFDDKISGTTAISFYFHGNQNRVTICNVGDSRAILGTVLPGGASSLTAVPLSKDQTPKREDEAERCTKAGARILSFSQIQPLDDEDDDDDEDDPPRVWAQKGMYPGTAFTRSIGDAIAGKLGVCAIPEMLTLDVSDNEKVFVLASDGVYDVLSNQTIIDICSQSNNDPAQACRTIIDKSYKGWIENDSLDSSDDITVICVFLGDIPHNDEDAAAAAAGVEPPKKEDRNDGEDEANNNDGNTTGRKTRIRQKTLRNLWTEDMKSNGEEETGEEEFENNMEQPEEPKRSNSL